MKTIIAPESYQFNHTPQQQRRLEKVEIRQRDDRSLDLQLLGCDERAPSWGRLQKSTKSQVCG
jgi:hypothetical protein